MFTRKFPLSSALLLAALSFGAFAQPAPGSGAGGMSGMQGKDSGMGGMPRGTMQQGPRDCAKAPNPEQCKSHQEARAKAQEACKDHKGPERRACMRDHMPPPDCAKARNPQRCEAMQKAREACSGKVGPERRQCMGDAMKAK